MTTKDVIEVQTDETLKHVFGAYLNMARNNLRIVLEYVDEKVFRKRNMNEDALHESDLIKSLLKNERPDEQQRATGLLKQLLPFLTLLVRNQSNSSAQDYASVLVSFIKALNGARNFYCHSLHQPLTIESRLVNSLEYLFDAARRKTKVRFGLSLEDIEHLVRKPAVKKGKKTEIVCKQDFRYQFISNNNKFTQEGLAYFICLFLERKYSELFLKKIPNFKDSRYKKYQATIDTYSILSLKLPKPRIQSSDNKEALLLDILEELKRCPGELFDRLLPEDQNRFRILGDDENGSNTPVLIKRFGDRFPNLVFRYFELTGRLPWIQFYIDLGTYNYEIYKKEVGGEQRLRRLQHHLKGFGYIEDFDYEKLPESWRSLIRKSHELTANYEESHIIFTHPHYHFVNSSIGIYVDPTKQDPILPDLNTRKNTQPHAWLSKYDLPAMVFLHLLTKKGHISFQPSQVINQYIETYRKFFSDLSGSTTISPEWLRENLENFNLTPSQIPKAIACHLSNASQNLMLDKGKRKLARFIQDTDSRLRNLEKLIERSKERPGSKYHRLVKTGRLADFLARDMLLLQPPIDEKKGKATSTLFQVLQARLAFYGRDKELLSSLYKECNLVDSENPHPFLEKVPSASNIVDFYRNYLRHRKQYMEKLLSECTHDTLKERQYHFLHFGERDRKDDSKYCSNLARKLSKMPFNLPRGLFIRPIFNHLTSRGPEAVKNKLVSNERNNTVFMLQTYMNLAYNDSTQKYYNWPRNYPIFSYIFGSGEKKSNNNINKIYFTPAQLETKASEIKAYINSAAHIQEEDKNKLIREYKNFIYSEKMIRHTKACDIVLFLMAKDLLMQLDQTIMKPESLNNFKLNEIGPGDTGEVMSLKMTFRFKIQTKTVVARDLKLKNYGSFKRLLKDNRIESLLEWYDEDEIEIGTIDRELEAYDRVRLEVQKLILEFESKCIARYGLGLRAGTDDHHLKHSEILKEFTNQTGNSIAAEKMNIIRNSFMHNRFPQKEKFENDILSDEPIAVQFRELYEKLMSQVAQAATKTSV